MFRTPSRVFGCRMVLAVLAISVVIPLGALSAAAAGPALTWNTFLGGAGHDRGLGITCAKMRVYR